MAASEPAIKPTNRQIVFLNGNDNFMLALSDPLMRMLETKAPIERLLGDALDG